MGGGIRGYPAYYFILLLFLYYYLVTYILGFKTTIFGIGVVGEKGAIILDDLGFALGFRRGRVRCWLEGLSL